MMNLLLLLLFGILLSFAIDKAIEDTLPPYVFTFLISLYILAILKKSHHAFLLSLFAFAAIWIFYIIRKKRFLPSFSDLKQKFTPLPVGFFCYLGVCVLMLYCFHNHFVMGWDDFHYNATFPKDMFYYGTMPFGSNSTTSYKEYLPLLQLFYYWGFQGIHAFREPLMFQYKIILIYTCMLPLFKQMNVTHGIKRISIFLLSMILPFISLIEILDSLSMDALMALIFGYAVIIIVYEGNRDWFCYYRIISALTALTLIKSIAFMFTGICLGIWLFTELCYFSQEGMPQRKKSLGVFLGGIAAVTGATASWKLFCRHYGNSTYLHQKLLADLNSTSKMTFPSYTADTLKAIFKSLFTLRLNFGVLGLTVAATLLISAILCAVLIQKKLFSIENIWCGIILFSGLVVYVAFLCYTYLFLFEDWEAESLSSLDRYLGTYVLTMLFIILYHFVKSSNENWNVTGTIIVTVVLLCTLNYPRIYESLIPSAYMKAHATAYSEKMRAEEETASLPVHNLDMHKMLIVNNTGNDMYSRTLDYCMIPLVTEPFQTTDFEEEKLSEELIEKITDRNIYYVYFTSQLENDSSLSAFSSLTDDVPIQTHTIYYFDNDTQKLKPVN